MSEIKGMDAEKAQKQSILRDAEKAQRRQAADEEGEDRSASPPSPRPKHPASSQPTRNGSPAWARGRSTAPQH